MFEADVVVTRVGKLLTALALAFFFCVFGSAKFTPHEIEAITPLVSGSPLFAWLVGSVGMNATSYVIGAVEIATGLCILARPIDPRISAVGGVAACLTFMVTLSFLVTTPDLDEATGGFIIKDLGLFAASLWWVGDCLKQRQASIAFRSSVAV